MVGLAESYLSELGYIVAPQVILLSFVSGLWFHNRSLTGWAFPSAMLVWWEIAIRHGLGVNDPLILYSSLPYTPLDLQQAQYLYFVVFTTTIVSCTLMGTAVAWLLGLPYLMPLESVWPTNPSLSTFNGPSISLEDYNSILPNQDAAIPDDCGLTAFGFARIPKQYFHFLITLILYVVTVALPFILFEWLYSRTILGAFLCGLLIPIAGYFVSGLFWRYVTSLYVFGPNDNNMKDRDDQITLSRKNDDRNYPAEPDLADDAIRTMVYANTNYNIWKTVLIMGGLHVLTFLLVGGVASFTDPVDVDVVWILGICLILAITLLIAIVVIIYHFVIKNRAKCSHTTTTSNSVDINNGDGEISDMNNLLNNKQKITSNFLRKQTS